MNIPWPDQQIPKSIHVPQTPILISPKALIKTAFDTLLITYQPFCFSAVLHAFYMCPQRIWLAVCLYMSHLSQPRCLHPPIYDVPGYGVCLRLLPRLISWFLLPHQHRIPFHGTSAYKDGPVLVARKGLHDSYSFLVRSKAMANGWNRCIELEVFRSTSTMNGKVTD